MMIDFQEKEPTDVSTPPTTLPGIAFIGAGNMATSLIGGLVAKGYTPATITASDPYAPALTKLAQQYGIRTCATNADAARDADIIVLAVKPQMMRDVCTGLAPLLQGARPLVVSIAAGISIANLETWLGATMPVVRCMPNTPALVQTGATALFANTHTTMSQRNTAQEILEAVGIALWLEEETMLDAVTALSGSGPAYFFLLIEAMIESGIKLGLDPAVARALTLQTALGAGKMAAGSDVDAAELRHRVTSPGGTTEKAILSFEQDGFRAMVGRALSAAADRSRELTQPYTD